MIDDDDFDVLHFANSKHQFRTGPQKVVLVRNDQTIDLAFDQKVEQTHEPLLAAVHAGAEIRENLEVPAFARTVEFEHLLLTLQIVGLIVTQNASICDCAVICAVGAGPRCESFDGIKIIAAMAGGRALQLEAPRVSQRRNVEMEAPRDFAASPMLTNLFFCAEKIRLN